MSVSKGAAGLGIAIIILLLSAGAIIGALFLPKILEKAPLVGAPQEHWEIIENMEILEVGATEVFSLEPVCVDHGLRDWGKGWPLGMFDTGAPYQQSTWIWQRNGDTEACMTIWGPGNDGKTYEIEVARLVGILKLEICYENVVVRTMPRIEGLKRSECAPGFLWFGVELE